MSRRPRRVPRELSSAQTVCLAGERVIEDEPFLKHRVDFRGHKIHGLFELTLETVFFATETP